jgi:hypothetical protein
MGDLGTFLATLARLAAPAGKVPPLKRYRGREEPGNGRVRIGQYSGLRKRMRAARRGLWTPIEPDQKAVQRHVHPRSKRAK